MLSRLLSIAPHLPDVWGEGSIFAFSGLDGETNTASRFVATYSREPYGLLFQTPCRRLLGLSLPDPGTVRLATGDVIGVEVTGGELMVAWSAWHTLAGSLPDGAGLRLRIEDGGDAAADGDLLVSAAPDGSDVLVLARRGRGFSLGYGRSRAEAEQRARAGLDEDIEQVAGRRLAFYGRLPRVGDAARARLLNKCWSVIKVNTLRAEGAMAHAWSTPDRVPHRDMWLWDSVFHSLAMNHLDPRISWEGLRCVLETQQPDGMIPHQSSVNGWKSAITQPPLLAWGVWENYRVLPDRAHLAFAVPFLERYLEWDLQHRDANHNGLLEWFIEGNVRCRSGESGMDNSPRFDNAIALDAPDFTTFAARDMLYLAKILRELGRAGGAVDWEERGRRMAAQVHRELWNPDPGFYCDRELDGTFSPVQAVSGFLPLLLPDLPAEHKAQLVRALQDPARFAAAFPAPSVALSDPSWSTDLWRGATWLNMDYLIILGLRRQGYVALAEELRRAAIAMVGKYYTRHGVLFEYYDATDRISPTLCDRKGPHKEPFDVRRMADSIRDYHWTAALTACLLMEEAAPVAQGSGSLGVPS